MQADRRESRLQTLSWWFQSPCSSWAPLREKRGCTTTQLSPTIPEFLWLPGSLLAGRSAKTRHPFPSSPGYSLLPCILIHLSIPKACLTIKLLALLTVLHSTKMREKDNNSEHSTLGNRPRAFLPSHHSPTLPSAQLWLQCKWRNWTALNCLCFGFFISFPPHFLYVKLGAWEFSVGRIKHWQSCEYPNAGSNKRKCQAMLIGCATSLARAYLCLLRGDV